MEVQAINSHVKNILKKNIRSCFVNSEIRYNDEYDDVYDDVYADVYDDVHDYN